jgi:hypothetical protein
MTCHYVKDVVTQLTNANVSALTAENPQVASVALALTALQADEFWSVRSEFCLEVQLWFEDEGN